MNSLLKISSGTESLDDALNGGIRRGSLSVFAGAPGSGHNIFAARFLFSKETQNKKVLWLSINAVKPVLFGATKELWETAINQKNLNYVELDITPLDDKETIDKIKDIIKSDVYEFIIINNADLLEIYKNDRIFLYLSDMLRKKDATSIIICSFEGDGNSIGITPSVLTKLADYIFTTRIVTENNEKNGSFNVIKSLDSEYTCHTFFYNIIGDEIFAYEDSKRSDFRIQATDKKNVPIYEVALEVNFHDAEEKRIIQNRVWEVNQNINDADFKLQKKTFNSFSLFEVNFREFVNGHRKEDIFPININWLPECIDSGLIHPLEDLISEDWKNQYLPVALKQCVHNGKLWALPHLINVSVLVYRSDLLAKNLFKPPKTWGDLKESCDTIMKKENKSNLYGFGFQGVPQEILTCNFLEFLWNNGGEVYDPSYHVTINNSKAVEALEVMLDLIYNWRLSPPSVPDMTETDISKMFFNENLIFMREWIENFNYSFNEHPDMQKKMKLAPLPVLSPYISPQSVIGFSCYVIPKYVKNPRKVIQFYKDFYSSDYIADYAIKGWGCPVFKSAYTNPDVLHHRPYFKDLPDIYNNGRSRAEILYYTQLTRLIKSEINLVLKKVKTSRDALDTIANEYSKSIFHKIHLKRLDSAFKYIDENLAEDLSRPIVASKCHLSPSYFGSLLKQATGLSFTDYLNFKRIENAKNLLETSELNVAQISMQVGFTDQGYFCQVFKKLTKMTPKQYRVHFLSKITNS